MPKKNSSWGVNTKSAEAKERKAEKIRGEQETKQKDKEDHSWEDSNKLDQKKKERKEKDDKKKLDALSRKQESKKLLEEEEKNNVAGSKLTSKGGGKSKKTTLSEIDKIKEIERKKQEQRLELREKEKNKITENHEMEPENPNRKMAELMAAEDAVEARSVGDALSVLNVSGSGEAEDKHPEKRMKAAYNEFEERELPKLKEEYPKLRLSQLKQMLHKEWQKSPDNPMNK